MNPDSFAYIVDCIRDHIVFKNNAWYKQADVFTQLLVCLRRLGSESSSASAVMSTSHLFGIGEETCTLYTKRCTTALASLFRRYVCWPTAEEKLEIQARIQASRFAIWEDVVGIVDGTNFNFKFKPYKDHWLVQYFNHRKKAYGLQATVICNDRGEIIYFHSQFPSSVHDARAFRSTRFSQHPGRYLARNEMILGDQAYRLCHWCIIPFKAPRLAALSEDHTQFNCHLSGLRIKIEHTIGRLKGRWSFLRKMPIKGNLTQHQEAEIYRQIASSVVLHNLLHRRTDTWTEDDDPDYFGKIVRARRHMRSITEMGPPPGVDQGDERQRLEGVARRNALFERFLSEDVSSSSEGEESSEEDDDDDNDN